MIDLKVEAITVADQLEEAFGADEGSELILRLVKPG